MTVFSYARIRAAIVALVFAVCCLFAAAPQEALAYSTGDDYPYKSSSTDTVDRWKFYARQCTSFAAWCLESRNGVAFSNYYLGAHWGYANHWDDAARSVGITVDSSPAIGAIAQTDSGSTGHVAWVSAVSGDYVTIEEYNSTPYAWSQRTVHKSKFCYIHVNDLSQNHDPVGCVDAVVGGDGQVTVSGWAFDPDSPSTSISVHVYIGGPAGSGEGHNIGAASDSRPDVNSAYSITGDHGFATNINTGKTGSCAVYIYAINVGTGTNQCIGSATVNINSGNPVGCLDSAIGGAGCVTVRGWAFDPNATEQSDTVYVYVGGDAGTGEKHVLTANATRTDVDKVYGCGSVHGFQTKLTTSKSGTVDVYVYAANIGAGTADTFLGKKTVTITPVVTMYRLYNPNSGEHFYTANAGEKDNLVSVGWNYEGIGWYAPKTSGTPVYRMYNPNPSPKTGSGEHHYTTSAAEKDSLVAAGWQYEGIGWHSADESGTPLYRFYNPNEFNNNHHYTTSATERDHLLSLGWQDEGIAWYGV